MKIEITTHEDNYEATPIPLVITETEDDKEIWLELGNTKVAVKTEQLLRAVSTFMPTIIED